MTLRTLGFCLLVLLPAVVLAAAPAPAAQKSAAPKLAAPPSAAPKSPQPATTWESYRILSERNIFTRNRSKPSSGRSSRGSTPSAPVVSNNDGFFVLTGIIQQGEDCLAFFEDTRTGKTATVGVGEALERGRLVLITRDIVHYACDGNLKKIEIGSTLAGTTASFPKSVTTTTTATSSAKTSAASSGAASTSKPEAPAAGALGGSPGVTVAPGAVMMTIESGAIPLDIQAPPPPPAATGAATAAGTLTTQPPAAPPQAAGGTSGGVGNAASIEEQMRQRREQEINK